jgi:hypothetical protein
MSFNKRYVDSRKILIYKDRLGDLFTDKIDAFIFSDNFSKEIFDLYEEKKFDLIRHRILEYETKSLI